MRAFYPGFGPDHITLRGRIREHEEAGGVSAIAVDYVVGINNILLRLRHLFDRTDGESLACRGMTGLALAIDLLDHHIGRGDPFSLAAIVGTIGLVNHHTLREQSAERLLEIDMPGLTHGAGEEA